MDCCFDGDVFVLRDYNREPPFSGAAARRRRAPRGSAVVLLCEPRPGRGVLRRGGARRRDDGIRPGRDGV